MAAHTRSFPQAAAAPEGEHVDTPAVNGRQYGGAGAPAVMTLGGVRGRTGGQGRPAQADRAPPAFIQQYHEDSEAERRALVKGLLAPHATLQPKYFYDLLGSRLFEAITALPEYYPTRTEARIFNMYAPAIASRCGTGCVLIDLGAGNCEKAAKLFGALRPAQYVALDISVEFLADALTGLQRQHPDIPMLGLGADLCAPLALPDAVRRGRRLFFYPGSSIGNFSRADALALLRRLRAAAQPGDGVLIGVDLYKDERLLVAAYDDALGVTAAFNRNVLRNVNARIGASFVLADWRHVASFDAQASRIQMHLQAARDVEVHWPGGGRAFREGERIHTEDSHKYRSDDFAAMLVEAGFADPVCWTDPHRWFAVFHARA
ncbi:dimethylhistidine N-methyltransferase [Cupriavidus gilardii J11]|uniref:Dimethylhistidine N-methyltransferase n=1 Tax=Cupriavidus gilardii J11 TaxID=936133 RepID=A0A562BWA4_9BURK|nr:L-histidine N(alpha)-methyltransferase [Cupriavidus gilardii]TWG89179.1 dimethylhistidine N-methyltransferase [Cupriavidus gilardii J11]